MTTSMLLDRADFADHQDLDRYRRERWSDQLDYVMARSGFYRRRFARLTPDADIERLAELPLTDKEMLREDQRGQPPFGSYLAARANEISRIHRTSGTTGVAMNIALTAQDAAITAAVGARALVAAGLGPGHRVIHCLNYQLWMGGFTDHTILEATGAATVPFGVGDTARLIRAIRELSITAISCTPSYPAVIEQVIASDFPGLEPRDLGLKLGLFGGEAALDDAQFRRRLEARWGFRARNANYGVSDVLSIIAGQCETQPDLHFVGADVLYPELIDPDDESPRPWRDGETGELVLTHLLRQAQPLVRFRTGDVGTLTDTGRCTCGRTATRFRVIGRADDMVVVRGINVFPTMIAGVLNRMPELSGEFRIVLEGNPPYDALPLEAELAATTASATGLAEHVAGVIKSELGVTARVSLLAPGSLPRTAGKTRRVIRQP